MLIPPKTKSSTSIILVILIVGLLTIHCVKDKPLSYRIELTTASNGFDGETCWVHARAGVIPAGAPGHPDAIPLVVMTMQKLFLGGSDVFYALHNLRTNDLGKTWSEPILQPVFERQKRDSDVEVSVCDFWPRWHAATKMLLGTGHTVWYKNNRVMPIRKRHTAYAVYDPVAQKWLPWKELVIAGRSKI